MTQAKTKHHLLIALLDHCGQEHSISAKALAIKVGVSARKLRGLVTECRIDGTAICGHPSSGYFVARNTEEVEETIAFLKHRALTSLMLASTLGKRPLADLIGQLHINA